jgi:hypothetical protein
MGNARAGMKLVITIDYVETTYDPGGRTGLGRDTKYGVPPVSITERTGLRG